MKARNVRLLFVTGLFAVCCAVQAAQTVKGTVVSSLGGAVTVRPDGGGDTVTLKPMSSATILRGQMGMEMRKAAVADLAPGDRVVAVVNQDGQVPSLKAFYSVAKGTLSMKDAGRLFFKDGRFVKVANGARVVLASGKVGSVQDLKPGSPLICRLNPLTEEAWMIVASGPVETKPAAAPKTQEVAVAPVVIPAGREGAKPAAKVKGFTEISTAASYPRSAAAPAVKPVIEAVTYVAPSPLKARDWMRVDVVGTPNGRAVCEVKGLIPRTVMKEIEPGKYRASVMVPSNKFARNEPLLAHLTVNGVDAPTVQASKLITVEPPAPTASRVPEPAAAKLPVPEPPPAVEPAPAPEEKPAAEVAPVSVPAPVVPPSPEPSKTKLPVVLTAPVMGTRVLRTLLVTGTAEPGSNVMVSVSYTNGLGGILNLSGQVSSQLVAVNADGQFQMGPIPLEGPLATRGLIFTVKACYPDSEKAASVVSVFGDRG